MPSTHAILAAAAAFASSDQVRDALPAVAYSLEVVLLAVLLGWHESWQRKPRRIEGRETSSAVF